MIYNRRKIKQEDKPEMNYIISVKELEKCPVCGVKYGREGKYIYKINCEHKRRGRHSLENYKIDPDLI